MQRYAYLLRKELDLIVILKKKKMNWKDFITKQENYKEGKIDSTLITNSKQGRVM